MEGWTGSFQIYTAQDRQNSDAVPPAGLGTSSALHRSIPRVGDGQGCGGKPVRVEQAQRILVAVLGVLAGYYGYEAHVAE